MIRIGAHVSTAGGLFNAPGNARRIKARALALFVKNPRQLRAPPLAPQTVQRFAEELESAAFQPEHVLPHDGYLINLGHPDKEKRTVYYEAFLAEMKRCEELGLRCLNIHPGAHLKGCSEDACLDTIAACINSALEQTRGVRVVVENTAGQGSAVGYRFEHLGRIVDRVEDKTRIGVCFDTCHAFAAGYDIRTPETYQQTITALDKAVGLSYLRGVHLNDARRELGSRVDRHESIGKGAIGRKGFANLMNDPRLDEIPMILETPDDQLWAKEIRMLYRMREAKNDAATRRRGEEEEKNYKSETRNKS